MKVTVGTVERKKFFIGEKEFDCFLMPVNFYCACPNCGYSNLDGKKENKFWQGDIVYKNVWNYLFWPIEAATFCPKCEKLIYRTIE